MSAETERYELAATADGAVLMDLRTGVLFRLNASAALAWALRLGGRSEDEIAETFAGRFALRPDQALRDVRRALLLPAGRGPEPEPSPLLYERVDEGYRFLVGGVPMFLIEPKGRWIEALEATPISQLGFTLRGFIPKIAALLGAWVLHASSVRFRDDGRAALFVGKSGAGKTTTARAFCQAGCELLSEDKVVLDTKGGPAAAIVGGEAKIHAWMIQAEQTLAKGGRGTRCDTTSLAEVTSGERLPLREILFLAADRRRGSTLALTRLGQTEALERVFTNGFHGSNELLAWRHQLEVAAEVGRHVPGYEATTPDGLPALASEALRYVRQTA